MKKGISITLYIFIFCFSFILKTSAETFGNNFCFEMELTDPKFKVRQISKSYFSDKKLSSVLNMIENSDPELNVIPKSPIFLGVKLNPALTNYYGSVVKSITKSYSSYIISDSTDAIIIALGITEENVHEFIYHVLENDSVEIVPWSPITKLEQKYGADQPYANIGTYNSPGNQILVEVLNRKDYSIRDGIIFDWRINFTPVVKQIVTVTSHDVFNLNDKELNRNYVTQFDQVTGMPVNLKFPVDSISYFRFSFKNHETLPYVIVLNKEIKNEAQVSTLEYKFLKDEYDFDSKYFRESGKYELIIQWIGLNNGYKEDQRLRFNFEVLPPPVKANSYSFMEIASFGTGVLLLIAIAFSIYYFLNKRRLKNARQQKEFIGLKLRSIQSQLNPHFMFNALSSIQNLMNKNDIEGANHYLGKFSGLTRKVLDTGENQMISLEDELKILEDYLQMEQLRFGFLYEIEVDNQINKANIEVPAMLLQPLVENAVKHGVSGLNKSGLIKITVSQNGSNLNLQVTDNGTGFSEELVNGNSLGIKLVKERIKLLNQFSKEHLIALTIESGKNGTTNLLKLENWV